MSKTAKVLLTWTITNISDTYQIALSSDKKWFVRYLTVFNSFSKWEDFEPQKITFIRSCNRSVYGTDMVTRMACIDAGFSGVATCIFKRDGKRMAMPKYRLPR